jgi:streptogramin lyase
VYLGYIEPVTGLYRMDRYDTTTWELTTALLVHNQVSAHTVDTMGMVWVSKSDTGRLVAIDPGSRSDVASIQAPGRITALAVDTGRRILYAAAADASRLYVIPIR